MAAVRRAVKRGRARVHVPSSSTLCSRYSGDALRVTASTPEGAIRKQITYGRSTVNLIFFFSIFPVLFIFYLLFLSIPVACQRSFEIYEAVEAS